MKTTVKKLADSKFEVTAEVDAKDWSDAQVKARKKAISNVQIKGFRKGHVPENMAAKHINQGEVLNDAINIVLPTVFTKAMEENKLNPFIRPTVNVDKLTTTELTIRFTVVVAPEVKLGNYKGIKITKKKVEVTDKEIDDSIKRLLDQNAELVVKKDAAKLGDTVILDFEGFVDGKAFEGGKAENYELALGSGQFVPGFEDQLVGLKANEKKEIKVKFPENYVENLKGKDATFKCLIHEVKEKKVPALNEETIKDLALPNVKSVDDLKKKQKEDLTKSKQREVDNIYYNDLVAKITDDSKIDVASEIIEEEVKAMKDNMIKQIEQNGLKWDQYLQITGQKEEDYLKKSRADAERNIRQMLVLNEISRVEKVTVTPDDLKAEYKRLADMYKMDEKKVEELLSKDLNNFVNQLRSQKLYNLLISLNK